MHNFDNCLNHVLPGCRHRRCPVIGGNNNYLLSNSCNNIQGLTVSLHVTKDMVADVTPGSGGVGTPNGGFAMQLNANPPAGEPVFWMQYGIIIENNQALGFIQY